MIFTAKKKCFENVDTKNIRDNKTFRKTLKTLLSNKCRAPENITTVKRNDTISDNGKIADVFNHNGLFANVVTNLNITLIRYILCDAEDIELLKNIRNTPVSKQ